MNTRTTSISKSSQHQQQRPLLKTSFRVATAATLRWQSEMRMSMSPLLHPWHIQPVQYAVRGRLKPMPFLSLERIWGWKRRSWESWNWSEVMGIILHSQDNSDPAGTVQQSKGYARIQSELSLLPQLYQHQAREMDHSMENRACGLLLSTCKTET